MPDLKQRQPDFSHSGWSKDGARLTATQDSTSDWREEGAQVKVDGQLEVVGPHLQQINTIYHKHQQAHAMDSAGS